MELQHALDDLYLEMNMSQYDNLNLPVDFATTHRDTYKETISKVLKILNENKNKLEKMNYHKIYDNGGMDILYQNLKL